MSLLELPAELVHLVMDNVGSAWFQEDLGRLTICKEWYKYAQPTCYQSFWADPHTLRSLLDAPNAAHTWALVKTSMLALDLNLPGHNTERCPASRPSDNPDDLSSDLAKLARMAKDAPKLRRLLISDFFRHSSMAHPLGCPDFVRTSTLQTLCSAGSLAILDVDLCGTSLSAYPEDGDHICTIIGNLLASLTRLRLRTRTICIQSLTPPENAKDLRLTEVVVNLSLYRDSTEGRFSMAHARPCHGGAKMDLKNDMEGQAKALLDSMRSPTKFRLLRPTYPHLRMVSLDVMTGEYMELDEDADWVDDGRTIVDDVESESDIVTSDSSVSSDL